MPAPGGQPDQSNNAVRQVLPNGTIGENWASSDFGYRTSRHPRWKHACRSLPPSAVTVAGVPGASGYSGEGVAATVSLLSFPVSITAYGGGYVITNRGSCRLTMLANNTLSTFAGTGSCGMSGDGAAATLSTINPAWGLAVADPLGPGGGLVFADTGNNVVRRVLPSGVIVRVAGTGVAGYSGACPCSRCHAPATFSAC